MMQERTYDELRAAPVAPIELPCAVHAGAELYLRAMIDKRRARWDERAAESSAARIAYDRRLVEAAARHLIERRELMRVVLDKPWLLVELAFTVIDKAGVERPFFFNEAQVRLVRELETEIAEARARGGHPRPLYVLKGRQQGVTSWVTAVQLAAAITRKNFRGLTLADKSDSTTDIFNSRARAMLERLPALLRPREKYNSVKELFFDRLNSSWRAQTATGEVARGMTLQMCHLSEIATYRCKLSKMQASVGQALAAGAWIFYETTANGFGEARDLWERGTCRNVFLPWWIQDEYRERDVSVIERACRGDAWLCERVRWLRERGLDDEQVAWYCLKYDGFLEKDKMRQEYPCFADEAFVFSGASIFNTEAVAKRLAVALTLHPIRVGTFAYKRVCEPIYDRTGDKVGERWRLTDIAFEERADGMVRIHAEPRVVYRDEASERVEGYAPYALGGDTAGDGEDYYTAKVVDGITLKSAATMRVQRTDDELYAEQVICLAQYYHMALIAVEINFSPAAMRAIVQKYEYPHIYLRERFDKLTDAVVEEPGFRTDKKTKPVIIGQLQADLRTDPDCDPDPETLRELLTFVRHPDKAMGAVTGAHDDLVMALAIAHHAVGQGQRSLHKERPTWGSGAAAVEGIGDPYSYPDEAAESRASERMDMQTAMRAGYRPFGADAGASYARNMNDDTVGGDVYGGWED